MRIDERTIPDDGCSLRVENERAGIVLSIGRVYTA